MSRPTSSRHGTYGGYQNLHMRPGADGRPCTPCRRAAADAMRRHRGRAAALRCVRGLGWPAAPPEWGPLR